MSSQDEIKMTSPGPPPKESIKEMKARRKREMAHQNKSEKATKEALVFDPYSNVNLSCDVVRRATGFTYDTETLRHKCEWDALYPENPQRLRAVTDRCFELGLIDRCINIPNFLRTDLYKRVTSVHTVEMYNRLMRISQLPSLSEMESDASNYDAVYFNKYTFDAASRSLSSVLNLITAVVEGDSIQNGIALVRPPGHHAMANDYCGYCYFNNVAIAAQMCIDEGWASKILIVDFDVHHGQGTQQKFYERKDVLYFSIHRYEHGTFWPNLLESNFNYIGKGEGFGYNINVPLNETGLSDGDYLAIVFNILLPVAYEFNPDLVIVSAGYDACVGCPEGRMHVTPGFYAHLVALLSGLANGKIAVCLEGGYFLPSLAEGAAMTLRALLGDPCPLLEPIRSIHPTVIESICNVRRALMGTWKCFSVCEKLEISEISANTDDHKYEIKYFGEIGEPPFATRNCYPTMTAAEIDYYSKIVEALKSKYTALIDLPVYIVCDDKMLLHRPKEGQVERPERPERLSSIKKAFAEFGITNRCVFAPIISRDYSFYDIHDPDYVKLIDYNMKETKDVYVNEHSNETILIAVSGLLQVIDSVMSETASSGVAVIRPPGHHAEYNQAMGFCLVNNIAIAANYLTKKYNVERCLIIDFDIHHGNGTQNFFYHTKNVMYISIHRYDEGKFFPNNTAANYTYDGYGCGQGFNINIPFSKDRMGNTEYLAAFHNIILPLAYSYSPEIVLVSAGFDAGINDPLGGYQVSPETFAHFIQMLKPLAGGRLILSLEGGYNLTTTSLAMTICTKVLLGDPVPMPHDVYKSISPYACETIRTVSDHFKKYWPVFNVNKKLSLIPVLVKKFKYYTDNVYGSDHYKILDVDKAEDSEYVEREMKKLNEF